MYLSGAKFKSAYGRKRILPHLAQIQKRNGYYKWSKSLHKPNVESTLPPDLERTYCVTHYAQIAGYINNCITKNARSE